MNTSTRTILAVLTVTLSALSSLSAQDGYVSTGSRVVGVNTPHIRVVGEASVTAHPNRAKIQIGVVNEAPTEREAASLAARQLSSVVSAVRDAANSDSQVSTHDYSIVPVYEDAPLNTSVEPIRNPRVVSYRATNIVEIHLSDAAHAQSVVDAASRAGADSVQAIEYSLENDQTASVLALKQAVVNARNNALIISNSMEMTLDGVQNIAEDVHGISAPFESVALRGSKRTLIARGSIALVNVVRHVQERTVGAVFRAAGW